MKAGATKGKFSITQLLLRLCILAAVGYVVFNVVQIFENAEKDRETLAKTAELRALLSSVSAPVRGVATGEEKAFKSLNLLDSSVHNTWHEIKNTLNDEEVDIDLIPLDNSWLIIRGHIDQISVEKETILYLHRTAETLNNTLPELQGAYAEVVDILVESKATPEQVAKAQEQLWLAERIGRNIDKIELGTADAEAAADHFNRDARLFGRILTGMQEGDAALGIIKVDNQEALESLAAISAQFEFIGSEVETIFESTPVLFRARKAADGILDEAPVLLNEVSGLSEQIKKLPESRQYTATTAIYGAGAAVFFFALSSMLSLRSARKEFLLSAEANSRHQEAILQLLDEIADLADGDLTSNATVTEDFTGAIADSINYTIEQLRVLVARIVNTSSKVMSAANKTRLIALELSEASEQQAEEVVGATTAIDNMAATIDQVSQDAFKLGEEAERSVAIARNGGQVVRSTIQGMDDIREQIQDTSKRIKRLGESSQEVGDIVSLINEIAEQTNILALNAAIQASMAGEAGRGFAVVADEVQGLAERSASATKQIASLVRTIQTDTNEAVSSMEQTTSEVVGGADLAHKAGESLEEIESVSADLAQLIQGISLSAKEQAGSARTVSGAMHIIRDISSQTLVGTAAAAESIGELADISIELNESVSDFTLPEVTLQEIEATSAAAAAAPQSLSQMTGYGSYDDELESFAGVEPAAETKGY